VALFDQFELSETCVVWAWTLTDGPKIHTSRTCSKNGFYDWLPFIYLETI